MSNRTPRRPRQGDATRRRFLQQTAAISAGALAAGVTPAGSSGADDPGPKSDAMPIIDTHQHLWDLRKLRLPWIREDDPLAKNFLPEDYRQAAAGLNVVKCVYMEVDVEPTQQDEEAEYVIELCRQGDQLTAAAVISGRPAEDGFRRYIARYRDHAYVKGLRQVLHGENTPAGYCLQPEFVAGIRLLGEMGLSYDICMRPGELADAAKLIDACPDTRFMLDHCGNADVQANAGEPGRSDWRRGVTEVAQRPNVFAKISGIVASARPGQWTADDLAPFVNHTLDAFGPERVVFGGDWPVCTLAATLEQWVSALKEIVASRDNGEQRRMFHDNAVTFYRLA